MPKTKLLNDESDEFLEYLLNQALDIVKALATNPAGIGLLAITAGLVIKGLPRPVQKDFLPATRIRANIVGLRLLHPDIEWDFIGPYTQAEMARRQQAEQSAAHWCEARLAAGETEAFNAYCERYVPASRITLGKPAPNPYDPIIDLFPFTVFGIPKEFGEVHLSDALLAAGILAISGQALSKIV